MAQKYFSSETTRLLSTISRAIYRLHRGTVFAAYGDARPRSQKELPLNDYLLSGTEATGKHRIRSVNLPNLHRSNVGNVAIANDEDKLSGATRPNCHLRSNYGFFNLVKDHAHAHGFARPKCSIAVV